MSNDWIKHDTDLAEQAYQQWVDEGMQGHDVIGVGEIAARLAREASQHLIDAARKEGLQAGLKAFDEARLAVEGDIQKLCDAARLEGIRLGLMAAERAIKALYVECAASAWRNALEDASMDVCALNPDTIAREAQDMGSGKETT